MVNSGAAGTEFDRAVASLRDVHPRPEIRLEEVAGPQRLAPDSFALAATVVRDGTDVAAGRLVLLHDPAGQEAWAGTMRLVCYVSAELEPEMGGDPMLAEVGWSWLLDALDAAGAGYHAAGGTVTQTTSTRFGELADTAAESDLELRASWSPSSAELGPHVEAWCALLAATAGLPPPGVTALPAMPGRSLHR